MIACQREFKITVNGAPVSTASITAYWTLDEAAGNRVDKVAAVPLVLSSAIPGLSHSGAVPALFSNGIRFFQAGGGTLAHFYASPNAASLATTGLGFSLCFWIKVIANDPAHLFFSLTANAVTGASLGLDLGSSLGFNGVTWADDIGNSGSIAAPINADSAWHFIHTFFDGTGKFGIGVDGAAPTLSPGGNTCAAAIQGELQLVYGSFGAGGVSDLTVDEIAISSTGMFSDPQVAYLYNGGVGRTWPITLP